jgi:small-conductance mechanosensitive channel
MIDLETFILLAMLGLIAFLFYHFFLRNVSEERHRNLKTHFKNLANYFLILSFSYGLFFLANQIENIELIRRVTPYLALICFFSGAIFLVKCSRLLVLMYLFLGSMRAGVPLLLVNIFSLVLSILIGFWAVNVILGVQLTPLLATSAAFSIILGLALQDTLGNLFAGISLQIDKTFEIGDWLEIMNGTILIVGQVKELSWRSTVLVGFSDEMITLPNKLVAQSQVSNFSPENQPILRSQTYKFPFNVDPVKAKDILEQAASQISEVRGIPAPYAYVREMNDYGMTIRLIYFLDNYGKQFVIGDKVATRALNLLEKNNIQILKPTFNFHQTTV